MANIIRTIFIISFTGISFISNSQKPVKKTACSVWEQKNPIQFIRKNAKTLLTGKDECVLSLLDTLGKLYIKKDSIEYLICLDSLYRYSDGYVSDYFLEVGERIFFNQFKKTIKYTYRNRSKSPKLKQLIIYSISSKLSDSQDSKNEKQLIFDFMNKEIQKGGFSNDEIAFIQKLKAQFDEKLFD